MTCRPIAQNSPTLMHADSSLLLLANGLIEQVYHCVFRSCASQTNTLSVNYLLRLAKKRVSLRSIQIG